MTRAPEVAERASAGHAPPSAAATGGRAAAPRSRPSHATTLRIRSLLAWAVAAIVVLALWELLARTLLAGTHLLGAPTGMAAKLAENAELYAGGLLVTGVEALAGFAVGALAAVLLGGLVAVAPWLERTILRLSLVVYCLPLVALGPLLRLLFGPGDAPQNTLAALAVYYLVLVPLLVGLRAVPSTWLELVRVYGRGAWSALIAVRARAALPYLAAGLQAAVPAAFLGALVGEYTGAERGLGVLSILAMRSLDTDGLWAIMLIGTLASLLGYWLVALVARRLAGEPPSVLLSPPTAAPTRSRPRRWLRSAGGVLATTALVLALWAGLFAILRVSPYFGKRPWDVWQWLVAGPAAAGHRDEIVGATAQTLAVAVPGYLAGLALGVGLAALFALSGRVARALTPVTVALRCVPIIAIAPLVVGALGRGAFGTTLVVALLTFFPTLVSCLQGLRQLPGQVADVFASYAAGPGQVLLLGRLPAMAPAFFAAARIAAPSALLAATVAEWLATGTGLGNLMAVDAATSRYGSLWSTVVVVTVVALLAYALVELVERVVLARLAPEQSRW